MDLTIPDSYESWKYCITVQGGIPLTKNFIQQRLAEPEQSNHPQTQQFTRLYGEACTRQVTGWYRQALTTTKNLI